MTWTVAQMAVELHLAPRDILEAPEEVVAAMIRYMDLRARSERLRGGA